MGNRIFYILNDFHELPKCANPSCGKTLRVNFKSCSKREDYYSHFCCARCVQLSPRVREKIEETTTARHGCKRGDVKPGTVKKREATMVERHGHKSTMQCPQLRAKVFKTNLERYVAVSPFCLEKVQEAIKKNVENFGVEHPFQSPAVQEKAKQTLLENYGVTTPMDSSELKLAITEDDCHSCLASQLSIPVSINNLVSYNDNSVNRIEQKEDLRV